MSRKIILIKQELLLLVYELNRSGLLAENEKIRPILAQLEKLLLCDLSPRSEERFSRNAETDLVCRLLLEKKKGSSLSNNTLDWEGTTRTSLSTREVVSL